MRNLFIALIRIYQFVISPILTSFTTLCGFHSPCLFPESCSHFAVRQIKEQKQIHRALILIAKRLMSCGPWAIERV